MMVDLPDQNFHLYTLDGEWIREANLHCRPVEYGMVTNAANTGASSNRHNPAFMLAAAAATEEHGNVYGFNLVYSGNHASYIEKSRRDIVRSLRGSIPTVSSSRWRRERDLRPLRSGPDLSATKALTE